MTAAALEDKFVNDLSNPVVNIYSHIQPEAQTLSQMLNLSVEYCVQLLFLLKAHSSDVVTVFKILQGKIDTDGNLK